MSILPSTRCDLSQSIAVRLSERRDANKRQCCQVVAFVICAATGSPAGLTRGSIFFARTMDCRVKPGNDDVSASTRGSRSSGLLGPAERQQIGGNGLHRLGVL